MSSRVAVLGGGVAGVTVAGALARHGVEVDLLESSERLGGLHQSVTVDGYCFDIGAFIFTPEHELLRSFPELLPQFLPAQPGYARITPSGHLDVYPLSIAGFVRDEGLLRSTLAVGSLLAGRARFRHRSDVPSYAKFHMGERIYERSGLRRYVERLYGLPDHEVGLEFALQRLRMLERYTPRFLIQQQLRQLWHQLQRRRVPGSSRAIVRPPQGFSHVYNIVRDRLASLGVHVHLHSQLESIRRHADGFILRMNGRSEHYERVVSTIPIPTAQQLLSIDPWRGFETMSLYSLFYTGTLRHDNAIQYNFTDGGRWKRITSFSKYYGRRDGRDWWVVEITTRDRSHASLAQLREDFEAHARSVGLYEGEATFLDATVTENAYPVFRAGYSERLRQERAKLASAGVDALGRQGAFEYLSSFEAAAKAQALGKQLGEALEHTTAGEPNSHKSRDKLHSRP